MAKFDEKKVKRDNNFRIGLIVCLLAILFVGSKFESLWSVVALTVYVTLSYSIIFSWFNNKETS